jgi:hypothetical protein
MMAIIETLPMSSSSNLLEKCGYVVPTRPRIDEMGNSCSQHVNLLISRITGAVFAWSEPADHIGVKGT